MPTKTAISFGLVHIPVSLHTATSDADIRFNMLHRETREKDEIKELPRTYSKQEVGEAELTMAKTLISSMIKPFEPSMYRDEYQARLKELISQKIAGKETVAQVPETRGNVIDLMEALTKSVEKASASGEHKKPKARKKAAV